ncbi:hypothetical protein NO2_1548 [Candidatus Termititenax persephonae]|uniref:Uncharacterized protein n=1 Tax=Candidatus Termititenax persephonae TaxID=2218525 RepID=A0A388TIM3_9BACT|nr:hypothetical protein NO2_1548 [Candidatus Termititenax persephonae]
MLTKKVAESKQKKQRGLFFGLGTLTGLIIGGGGGALLGRGCAVGVLPGPTDSEEEEKQSPKELTASAPVVPAAPPADTSVGTEQAKDLTVPTRPVAPVALPADASAGTEQDTDLTAPTRPAAPAALPADTSAGTKQAQDLIVPPRPVAPAAVPATPVRPAETSETVRARFQSRIDREKYNLQLSNIAKYNPGLVSEVKRYQQIINNLDKYFTEQGLTSEQEKISKLQELDREIRAFLNLPQRAL